MKHIKRFNEEFDTMSSLNSKHPSNLKRKEYSEIVLDIKKIFLENPLNGNFMTPLDGDFIVKYNKENDRTIITIENPNVREDSPGLSYGEFLWKEIKDAVLNIVEYVNKEKLSAKLYNMEDSYSFPKGVVDINDIGNLNRFNKLKIIIKK
jgi:hypothetical protein